MPVITTFHTVLAEPTAAQRAVTERIVDASSRVVVMAEKGRELLRTVCHVPAEKIEVMPHGIPDVAFVEPDHAKARFGFMGKAVILTFGLLSPNKGIEVMIEAMPSILTYRPDAVYVVLGATHPNLVRRHGEAYRRKIDSDAPYGFLSPREWRWLFRGMGLEAESRPLSRFCRSILQPFARTAFVLRKPVRAAASAPAPVELSPAR